MKNKNLILFTIFAILSAFVCYALQAVYMEGLKPEDNLYYSVNGTNFTMEVNCSPSYYANISSMRLYTNLTGTWQLTFTNSTESAQNTEIQYLIKPTDHDFDNYSSPNAAKKIIWGIQCIDNESNSTWSENRTIWTDNAPMIHSLAPADAYYSNDADVVIKYNITNSSRDFVTCEFYTNRSGNGTQWGMEAIHTSNNHSETNFTYSFPDGTSTIWQLICYEGSEHKIKKNGPNRTIYVDESVLTPVLVKPSETYTNNASFLGINMTCTGNYIENVYFYQDGQFNHTLASSPSSGTQVIVGNFTAPDGTYNITVGCNNSYGTRYNSSKFILIVDTNSPNFATKTNWTIYDCSSIGLNFTASEDINTSTIYYSKHKSALTNSHSDSAGRSYRLHLVNYAPYTESLFDINMTIQDNAGNKNDTTYNVTVPVNLCEGWNVYSIYDQNVNFSNLERDIGVSDYLYYYNTSGAKWVFKANGTAANGSFILPKGAVIYIYTSVDSSWYRYNTLTNYQQNITNGSNYIAIGEIPRTFNYIHNTTLKNITGGNYTNATYEFKFEYFAAWNNTGKRWVNYYSGFLWENATYIGKNANTSLDALWVQSSGYGVGYNTSGYIRSDVQVPVT